MNTPHTANSAPTAIAQMQHMVQSVSRSKLMTLNRAGQLKLRRGDADLQLDVHVEKHLHPDGTFDLSVNGLPESIRLLAMITRQLSPTTFPNVVRNYSVKDVNLPQRTKAGLNHPELMTLSGSTGESRRTEAEVKWENNRVFVEMEFYDATHPFPAVAVATYQAANGKERTVTSAFMLANGEHDGIWSGQVRLKKPTRTADGQIQLTIRPMQPGEEYLLDAHHDENGSEQLRFLAHQQFEVKLCRQRGNNVIVESVDPADVQNGNVLLKGCESQDESTAPPPFDVATSLRSLVDCDSSEFKNRFPTVWIQIQPRLHQYLIAKFRDRNLVEEALLDVARTIFLKRFRTAKDVSNLEPYVKTMATNAVLMILRCQKRIRKMHGNERTDFLIKVVADAVDSTEREKLKFDTMDAFLQELPPHEFAVWQATECWRNSSYDDDAENDDQKTGSSVDDGCVRVTDKAAAEKLGLSVDQLRTRKRNAKRRLAFAAALFWMTRDLDGRPRAEQARLITVEEHEVVYELEVRGVSKTRDLDPRIGKETRKRGEGSGLPKAEAAVALLTLKGDFLLTEIQFESATEWLFRGASVDSLVADFDRDKLPELGRKIHGQVLIFRDAKKARLYKAGQLFVESRILRDESPQQTIDRLQETRACEPTIKGPPKIPLADVPRHVATVWEHSCSLVPSDQRTLTLDELECNFGP